MKSFLLTVQNFPMVWFNAWPKSVNHLHTVATSTLNNLASPSTYLLMQGDWLCMSLASVIHFSSP